MKTLLRLFIFSLMAVACTTFDEDYSTIIDSSEELVKVSIEASCEEDDTRVALDGNKTAWEVGDRITVAFTTASSTTRYADFEVESAEDLMNNGKNAVFTGEIPSGTYAKIAALYPAVENASANVVLNRHAEDNLYMAAVNSYTAGNYITISATSANVPLNFSHLMHKVDYTLSVAAGCDTDISKGVAIEMLVKSDNNDVKSVQCYNYNLATGTLGGAASQAVSSVADFTSHNFKTTPTASTLIFPAQVSNASLIFNVYVNGIKAHTITKPAEGVISNFSMTAGRITTVALTLSEDNKAATVESEDNGAGDFIADININTLKYIPGGTDDMKSTGGNIGYRAYMDDGYFDLHFYPSDASSTSITAKEGYTLDMSYAYYQDKFIIRDAQSNLGLGKTVINSSNSSANLSVSYNSDKGIYTIHLSVTTGSKSLKIAFVGELNVENGGQVNGGGGDAGAAIELALLTAKEQGNGYTSFNAQDASGKNTINLHVNGGASSLTNIADGIYEYTTKASASYDGYFSVDSVTNNGTARNDITGGVMHVTKSDGNAIAFAMNILFEDGTSQLYTFDGVISAYGDDSITITASQSSILGNGKDALYFTALQNGQDVTSSCTFYVNDSSIQGYTFSSTTAGTYRVYAMKSGKKSNEITITVEEYIVKPITISASKTTLIANNSDSVTFTVKQENTDVTSIAKIYVNGVINNGSKFLTSKAGTYRVYATYEDATSNTITLTATEPDPSNYKTIFADGVTLTSGWYDVNKYRQGDNGDINMCWAASSANMLQWFQDRYKAAGNTLPAGCPDGPGKNAIGPQNYIYELELMEVFWNEWDNSEGGGQPAEAITWYFQGEEIGKSTAYPKTAGGYWKSIWSNVAPHVHHGWEGSEYDNSLYVAQYLAYTKWGTWSGIDASERLKKFSEYIEMIFEKGMCSMAISLSAEGRMHHATTIWGYEIDITTGIVTKLYITDSDDQMSNPKTQLLNVYNVSYSGGNYIELNGDTRYGTVYVISLLPFSGYGSAN